MAMRALLLFLCICGWSISLPAFAQEEGETYTLIGAGLRLRPAYDGSKSQATEVIPVLRYYGKALFARTTQGILEAGVRTNLAEGLALGAQLAYEAGRRRSESDFLRERGTRNLDPSVSLGIHLEWDVQAGPVPLVLLGRLRQDTDGDRGAQADARITAGVYQDEAVVVGVFTQATWASRKAHRTYYETGGSGLLFASLGALASYDFHRDWTLLGSVEARRLRGDAASSPLAERKSSAYASVGLAYRF